MDVKHCTKCKTDKTVSEFAKAPKRKDGLNGHCKSCIRQWRLDNIDAVKEKKRRYGKENAESINARSLAWRRQNPERARAAIAEWSEKNKDKKSQIDRAYRESNKDKVKEHKRTYYFLNKTEHSRRTREYALKHAERLRPLNAERTMRRYFDQKMSVPKWANMDLIKSIYIQASKLKIETGEKWEVDHIVPIKSKLVCGLHCESNLRVIPKVMNREKGNYFWPDMP